jgi:hypothetical protein
MTTVLKYPKPRILLVDVSRDCAETLREAGYNVAEGTFGTPTRVEPSGWPCHVDLEACNLANYEEEEIVIANVAPPMPAHSQLPDPGKGVLAAWQIAAAGVSDPRPLFMHSLRDGFQRILNHGGIFVIQLSVQYSINYFFGCKRHGTSHVEAESRETMTNWGFLRDLQFLETQQREGTEIIYKQDHKRIADLSETASSRAFYTCVVRPLPELAERWVSLATNKYGEPVAGIIASETQPQGYILVVPQMPALASIVIRLIENVFTSVSPHLFPFSESTAWTYREEYELPEINRLNSSIAQVEASAAAQISELNSQIESLREANRDWYALLNGTGGELVAAVVRSLKVLGFNDVVDVDAQEKAQGNVRKLREDLQIRDQNPVLIIDVKGVVGGVEDGDATQSEKHALMRSKEFGGEVKPLTIINHQRNIPPRDRNPEPYRAEIVDNATQTGLGLMTTWDLFRLLRNKERLAWPSASVMPILYRVGRIEPIPEHYAFLGEIVDTWKVAFGIVPKARLVGGSTIAIENGDCFEEIVAASLQVDDQRVNEACVGSKCGVGCEGADKRFRKGQRVFVVKRGPVA